jgi:hypothetical protein
MLTRKIFTSINFCLFVASFLIKYYLGCGIATHTEIAHRAAYNYEYLLFNNTHSVKEVRIDLIFHHQFVYLFFI